MRLRIMNRVAGFSVIASREGGAAAPSGFASAAMPHDHWRVAAARRCDKGGRLQWIQRVLERATTKTKEN